MDMTGEIFVMDSISGITPFALCSVTVDSIGSKVSGADSANITIIPNSILTDVVSKNTLFSSCFTNNTDNVACVCHLEIINVNKCGKYTNNTSNGHFLLNVFT